LRKTDTLLIIGLLCHSLLAMATATVPSLNLCADMVFIDGMQNDSDPSLGSGGSFPGLQQRTVMGVHDYYLYIPGSYQPSEAMPVLAVWHGAAGAGMADAAAQDMRQYWQNQAAVGGFILIAQVATGSQGGWVPTTDAQILEAIFADVEASYNIERTRRYLWGFSAGGFVMHAIALSNADFFSAYAVSGAHLGFASSLNIFPSGASRHIPALISVGQSDPHFTAAQSGLTDFLAAGWQTDRNLWFDDFIGGHVLLNHLPPLVWDKLCVSTNLD
jgi:hypothetical protein